MPTVNVITSCNLIHKKTEVLYSINLSGEKTLQVAKSIADVGVENYHYQLFERIFIDATGSLVSSKNLSEKMIYYYAMIIHHEIQGCEMLTSDQTIPN